MKKQKIELLEAPESSSDHEVDIKQHLGPRRHSSDSSSHSSSYENAESEMSENDLIDFNKPQQEKIETKFIKVANELVPELKPSRQPQKDEIQVEFVYAEPSEAYYHIVKAMLGQYLDGEEQESLDTMSFADYICERASIGQIVVSPLDPENDPDLIPELQKLNDEDFAKEAIKYNSERDVFGFGTLISLNYWSSIKRDKKHLKDFTAQIMQYVFKKAD